MVVMIDLLREPDPPDGKPEGMYLDGGTPAMTYSYDLHPSGAVRIIESPEEQDVIPRHSVIKIYAHGTWTAVQGAIWRGEESSLSGFGRLNVRC